MKFESSDSLEAAVTLLKALADATRLRMVGLMVDRSRSGQELASILGVSPPTVSHHVSFDFAARPQTASGVNRGWAWELRRRQLRHWR